MYDAIAPVAKMLELQSQNMANSVTETFTQTASGEALDWRGQERGVSRDKATYTRVLAKVTDDNGQQLNNISLNDRFASINDDNPIFYYVVKIQSDGVLLQADELGTRPNGYIGQILPVTPNDSLNWAEITEIAVPAKNEESDDSLRNRILTNSDSIAYGGNVSDYKKMLNDVEEIGAYQIYPTWKGGGTVKLVILNNELIGASGVLLSQVKNKIDPPETTGQGYGLAPIGHSVTVVAPSTKNISVRLKISTDGISPIENIKNDIKQSISEYFNEQRTFWGKIPQNQDRGYSLTIYRSQLLARVVKVAHVSNSTLPTLNDESEDISMIFNNEISELPILKEVIFDE
ncbi:baseplate J/gp47 family protein [Lactobacillus sp. S2-2]|uniref:baseplate J/gp47 family protein n=1 Tax=Lactobacillus sp. S2-2 TaxID=2692917 RepID=UPI001F1DC32E|nr:baseplate J/gp47 family protein [Lactobacillus sp. S2-2]